MAEVACVTTTTSKLRFMYEGEDAELEMREALVTERAWDVTDAEARTNALEDEIGPLGEDYAEANVMWYINPERNAAALLVFRHRFSPNRLQAEEVA